MGSFSSRSGNESTVNYPSCMPGAGRSHPCISSGRAPSSAGPVCSEHLTEIVDGRMTVWAHLGARCHLVRDIRKAASRGLDVILFFGKLRNTLIRSSILTNRSRPKDSFSHVAPHWSPIAAGTRCAGLQPQQRNGDANPGHR